MPPLLQSAAAQLRAGDVADAVNSLLTIPLLVALPAFVDVLRALQTVLTKPLQNLVNVITAFTSDVLGTELIQRPRRRRYARHGTVVSAILTAPATIADGFLNGGKYGPDLGPLVGSPFPVKAGGLLSSPALVINPEGSVVLNTGGPIAALEQIRQKIAEAITPTPTPAARSAVTSIPTERATTVTLSTAQAPVSTPTATTPESTAASTGSTEATTQSTKESTNTDTETTTKPATAPQATSVTSTDRRESVSSAEDSTTKVDTAHSDCHAADREGSGRQDRLQGGTADHHWVGRR